MKKKVILVLIFIQLCLGSVSCGDSNSSNNDDTKSTSRSTDDSDSGGVNDTSDTSDSGNTTDTSDTATSDTDTTDTATDTSDTATDTSDTDTSDTETECNSDAMNECGGCTTLYAGAGSSCGECGEYACNTSGGLDCVAPTPVPTRCNAAGNTIQTCVDGDWENKSPCSTGVCLDAACVMLCPHHCRM